MTEPKSTQGQDPTKGSLCKSQWSQCKMVIIPATENFFQIFAIPPPH